ncbi:MAG: hypothetical protein HQL69_22495 [Magnetococcales bacterium]|nr:hypothetical protein [Magnetococcales bacterium]
MTRDGFTILAMGYTGKPSSETDYVLSLNLHRRHLDESQRGMVAAKAANMKRGKYKRESIRANWSLCENDISIAKAAEKLKISTGTIKKAKTVLKKGTPTLQQQVEKGEVSAAAVQIYS